MLLFELGFVQVTSVLVRKGHFDLFVQDTPVINTFQLCRGRFNEFWGVVDRGRVGRNEFLVLNHLLFQRRGVFEVAFVKLLVTRSKA